MLYARYNEHFSTAIVNDSFREGLRAATDHTTRLDLFQKRDAHSQRILAALATRPPPGVALALPSCFGCDLGIPPEETLRCFHGGGLRHLREFLCGEVQGYRLEEGGTGIQVHPVRLPQETPRHVLQRTPGYACRARRYFDTPVALSFCIQARHLDASPNLYEAGCRPESIHHMTDLTLEMLRTGEVARGADAAALVAALARPLPVEESSYDWQLRGLTDYLMAGDSWQHPV